MNGIRTSRRVAVVTAMLLALGPLGGCGSASERSPSAVPTTASTVPVTSPPIPTTTSAPAPVVVDIRLERRAPDGTEGFEDLVRSTLTDPRGWTQAGFEIRFRDDAPHTILLAEAADVDATCLPYDTGGRYSCQNGPVVALNADRWREATPTWTGTLDDYRRMLVNHEVGHLLGRHHARPACTDGGPAAVMFQQSSGLDGCQPNPWPLPWEIACAARHDEPIAPGYEPDATATCGPDDV